jgi:predicted amidohydrolase YtcJ
VSRTFDLVLRQVQLPDGRIADVGLVGSRFSEIAPKLRPSDNDIDCDGGLLLPGLHDHHIHLLAAAAQLQSVDLSACNDLGAIMSALRAQAKNIAPGDWVRAIGYDERTAGLPDMEMLDTWLLDRPLRLQDRTGALWVLNSLAWGCIGQGPWPDAVETDGQGHPTGRIWRGDAWLRGKIGSFPPPLHPLSQQLARWGVTAVTDAGAQNGPEEAAILSAALRCGDLCQELTLMGREDLPASADYQLGPVKLLFDERALPEIDSIAARIRVARALGRAVAAHCVTEAELLTYLAALDQAGGARAGDRIEHGSMIPRSLVADIAQARLTVVANPGFIAGRGDRYRTEMDAFDLPNLHRLSSLTSAGITLLAGSDAPYGPANPWIAIRAAMLRKTAAGFNLGSQEALTIDAARALFSGYNSIQAGARADCFVVARDWALHVRECDIPNPVFLSLVGGALA